MGCATDLVETSDADERVVGGDCVRPAGIHFDPQHLSGERIQILGAVQPRVVSGPDVKVPVGTEVDITAVVESRNFRDGQDLDLRAGIRDVRIDRNRKARDGQLAVGRARVADVEDSVARVVGVEIESQQARLAAAAGHHPVRDIEEGRRQDRRPVIDPDSARQFDYEQPPGAVARMTSRQGRNESGANRLEGNHWSGLSSRDQGKEQIGSSAKQRRRKPISGPAPVHCWNP
jgi:hypothetical protein